MDRTIAVRIVLAVAGVVTLVAIGLGIANTMRSPAATAAFSPAKPATPAMPGAPAMGAPQGMGAAQGMGTAAPEAGAAKAASLDVLVEKMAARLAASGSKDPAEWELLGKAQQELQRPEEAAKAFERARQLRAANGPAPAAR